MEFVSVTPYPFFSSAGIAGAVAAIAGVLATGILRRPLALYLRNRYSLGPAAYV